MARRRAQFTKEEIRRAVAGALEAGAREVVVEGSNGGRIRVTVDPTPCEADKQKLLAPPARPRL